MKIRRRIAFHLTYQFILYALLIQAIGLFLLFMFLQKTIDDDLRRNFPNGALTSITTEVSRNNGEIKVPSHWINLLKERGMWLQIINEDGKVIYDINSAIVPSLPSSYSVAQLLNIQESGKYEDYSVHSQMDLNLSQTQLFLLGYKNPDLDLLMNLFNSYQSNGLVSKSKLPELSAELMDSGRYLQITDEAGTTVQSAGKSSSFYPNQSTLEILKMQQAPANTDRNIAVYRDPHTAKTWMLYSPNAVENIPRQPVVQSLVRGIYWMAVFIFVFSLAISLWHGYRYGQPLILFVNWFQKLSQGHYDQVLTEKDKRKVFKPSGKLKISYKLYSEVIQTFYHMAEQLAHTEKERKRLENAQEEWMSGISHDLRTPLATIQGYGYMLANQPGQWDQEELQVMGTMIREKGDYMLELITDFSLINQLKHGASLMKVHKLDLEELVRRSVLKYVNDATMSDCDFTYEGTDQALYVQADDNWLQRLLDNLLSNAVKHNRPGVTVNVSVGLMNNIPYIKVADNGSGMDETTQQNLFKRYYRGTNTEESTAGSGIGMSIAKAIVDAHGGEIKVHSAVGQGTEILILLPQKHNL
ncbi:sensor histidine kinase [Paenibacillus sp. GCM10012306]|uniref:HAMP domain-containing sensor histidine kinase n=1 Tax=Paenibacillus sp. GCM10012306 TaxID=3317342 RepID=UPI003623E516